MRRDSLYSTLPLLVIGVVAASIVWTRTPALESGTAQVVQTPPPEKGVLEQSAAIVAQESATAAESPFPAPAPALRDQTRAEEPPYPFRGPRDARLDAFSGRGAYPPPWPGVYGGWLEPYRATRRSMPRRQWGRDIQRQDDWMDALCPWSKPPPNGRAARGGQWYGQPYRYTTPAPW